MLALMLALLSARRKAELASQGRRGLKSLAAVTAHPIAAFCSPGKSLQIDASSRQVVDNALRGQVKWKVLSRQSFISRFGVLAMFHFCRQGVLAVSAIAVTAAASASHACDGCQGQGADSAYAAHYLPHAAYHASHAMHATFYSSHTACYAPQTSYQATVVSVPVASYQAVIATDPCTGCPVTVMRPVTTLVQQVRYSPVITYRPVCCPTTCCSPVSCCAPVACCAPAAPAAPASVPSTVPDGAPMPGRLRCRASRLRRSSKTATDQRLPRNHYPTARSGGRQSIRRRLRRDRTSWPRDPFPLRPRRRRLRPPSPAVVTMAGAAKR